MKCRRDRYLRKVYNYPKNVSIRILQAIIDDKLFEENIELFETWCVVDIVHFLRTDTSHHRLTDNHVMENINSSKRKRSVDEEDTKQIQDMLHIFKSKDFMTSHDHVEKGAVENFSCHSVTGLNHMMEGRFLSPFNYQSYIEVMEALNFCKQKPSLTILKNFNVALHFAELEVNMIKYDLEHYDDTHILEAELKSTVAYRNEFRTFLALMRSEYINTGVFEMNNKIASDVEEAIRYNNPHALLFGSFVYSFCSNSDKKAIAKMLCDCINNCGPSFKRTVEPFAKCALAMANMRAGRKEECLQTLNIVLADLPDMYRALDMRSQICMSKPDLLKQAFEDNEHMLKCLPELSSQTSKLLTSRAAMYAALNDKESEMKLHAHAMIYDPDNSNSLVAMFNNANDLNNFELFEAQKEKYLCKMSQPVEISKTLFVISEIYKQFNKEKEYEYYTSTLKRHALSWSRIS